MNSHTKGKYHIKYKPVKMTSVSFIYSHCQCIVIKYMGLGIRSLGWNYPSYASN